MIFPRGKLPWGWCVSGFCLGLLCFYLFIPVFYFGGSQTTEGHLRSEQVVKSDPVNLTSPEIDGAFLHSMLNVPEWYRKRDWGLMKRNVSLDTKGYPKEYLGDDNEVNITWNNFFYGTTNGLVLEMGAMDGNLKSVSKFYEYEAGWRSILIEGNPEMGGGLHKNRPNAISFNIAICEKPKTFHYVFKAGSVSGIVEFMTEIFLRYFHPKLLTNGKLDEEKLAKAENVVKVPCVPLSHLLSPLNISHINFFMLDVEGAELSVLKAIDFGKIKFDVIGVETDWGSESKEITTNKTDSLIQFLNSKGYELWNRRIGRNTWFKHPDFKGFSKN